MGNAIEREGVVLTCACHYTWTDIFVVFCFTPPTLPTEKKTRTQKRNRALAARNRNPEGKDFDAPSHPNPFLYAFPPSLSLFIATLNSCL